MLTPLVLTGAGMALVPVVGVFQDWDKYRFKRKIIQTFDDYNMFYKIDKEKKRYIRFQSFIRTLYGYKAVVKLPSGLPLSKFETCLEGLQQNTSSEIQLKHLYGSLVEIKFGTVPMYEKMNYDQSLAKKTKGLQVPVHTPFGLKWLDFHDGASYHWLVAGATRMGKSVFLRLIVTHLLHVTEGKIQFYYIDHKVEDCYVFENIPQIKTIELESENFDDEFGEKARDMLLDIQIEANKRRQKLKSVYPKAESVKDYNERYPDDKIHPIVVIIDEYARFAEDEPFQDAVKWIAETAGYLDIHLVVASQRPDVQTVLKARIRANLLLRVCFQTADEANSTLVLGAPDAYHLGRVQGRAIVLDGMPTKVQTPFISTKQTYTLLQPYRGEKQHDEPRQDDSEATQSLPSFVKGSVRDIDLSDSI